MTFENYMEFQISVSTNKVFLSTPVPVHLCAVCGCARAAVAQLSSLAESILPTKPAVSASCLTLYGSSVLAPSVEGGLSDPGNCHGSLSLLLCPLLYSGHLGLFGLSCLSP